MKKFRIVAHFLFLLVIPSLFAQPCHPSPIHKISEYDSPYPQSSETWLRPTSYDEIIQMLEDIESGALERRYSPMELHKVNEYLSTLAEEGLLPGEWEKEAILEEDIEELLYGQESGIQLATYLGNNQGFHVFPAYMSELSRYDVIQCGKISKAWKKTKQFTKKHKKAIIIGAVIVAVTTVVVVAVVATGGTAAGPIATAATAVAGASADSYSSSHSDESSHEVPKPLPETPLIQTVIEEHKTQIKEQIAQEAFFPSVRTPSVDLSWEETGRVVAPVYAHETFNTLNREYAHHPQFSQELEAIKSSAPSLFPNDTKGSPLEYAHHEIDQKFSSNYASHFSTSNTPNDSALLSYQMRGEKALSLGYYEQANQDFSKVIDLQPNQPLPYLQRSASHFKAGQYEKSIDDFRQYEQMKGDTSLPPTEVQKHFATGLVEGVVESGKGILLFLGDFIIHPIQTSTQTYEAFSQLAALAKNDEWGVIGQALSPDIHTLVTEWDSLTPEQQADLSGHALGKHGADILLPGALAKVTLKCAKGAKELAAVCRNLKLAQETLVLETAAEIGSAAKVGEVIKAAEQSSFLAEELGFTSKELGQLHKAGTLETTLAETYEHLALPMQESIKLFKNAQKNLKVHAKIPLGEEAARRYIHETGIPTFTRPKGIPENYVVRITERGAGMEYVHPENRHLSVRVMPGKSHSPHIHQQKPYVVQMKDGKAFDKFGNLIPHESPKAHIPLDEFIYRE